MKAALGKNVKISLPKAFQISKEQTKGLAVKGFPTDITDNEFKEFLDLSKISYAKAERLKCKKDGRVLSLFSTAINDLTEAEALTNTDRSKGSTDLLDMAFISPNLAKHDIQFQIGDDLGSDHLPIKVSIDASPHRNLSINHTKCKFDQTDREVFESTLEATLGSADFTGLTSTLDKYADFIVTAISTAVDKAIPKSKSVRSESNPISDETIALIKKKRRLRRQYSQNKDPAVKTRINQLQKQVRTNLG